MDVKVLGPLTINARGTSIVPSAGKPRQLLALLALRMGRVVATATMVEELWGDDVPRSAATIIQTYILHLRRKIAQALPDRPRAEVLSTHLGGYRLNVDDLDVDVWEFSRRVAAGTAALDAGDSHGAAVDLNGALALWRGAALEGVPLGRVLQLDALGMEEARTHAMEKRIDAELRNGNHAALLPELRVLVARNPLNENLCAQFMVALFRAGYTWRALEAFRTLRRCLIEELGVEPGAQLQFIHQAILAGELDLDTGARLGRPTRLAPIGSGQAGRSG